MANSCQIITTKLFFCQEGVNQTSLTNKSQSTVPIHTYDQVDVHSPEPVDRGSAMSLSANTIGIDNAMLADFQCQRLSLQLNSLFFAIFEDFVLFAGEEAC